MQRVFRSTARFGFGLGSGLLAVLATACVDGNVSLGDLEVQQGSYPSMTAMSPDGRYIVQYKNSTGRAAIATLGGRIVRDFGERNAAAAHLPDAAVQALRNNPNVELVEVDARRMPLAETVPYGVPMVQTNLVPATPVDGDAGRIKVCVIDSGLSGAHEDFAGQPASGTNVPGSGNWFEDTCGHGTHVAGTIAAATGNGLGVASVAAGAVQLHIVKVFDGADCGWSFSSDLVAALDACTAAGAELVSMSLGGSFKSRFEETAFASAFNNGVLSIAAAGNDGTTGFSYPASYSSVVSVAAIDQNKVVASFSQRNAQVDVAAPGVGVLSTYPYAHTLSVSGTKYQGGQIEFAALGSVSGALVNGGRCTTTGSFSGKVVLCERGDVSFLDKVMNVQNSGGVAAVLYNNVPGSFSGTLGAGNSSAIPAISLSQEDGQALVAASLGQTGTVASGAGDGYAVLDGTSMATPHVSAVAALVWAQVPGATNADIRDALIATAQDLGAAGRDDSYGNGLVQAGAALDYLLGSAPDCSADGVCNPDCAAGADPDCAPVCLPSGSTCSASADCCSNVCKKQRGQLLCQ